MKQALVVGLPLALFGVLLAAIPSSLLPTCAVQHGAVPMRCHWSGMMLVGFGAMFVIAAVLFFLCRTPGVRSGLSLGVILSAVLAGATPTYLIGVCGSPAMPCRTGTFPAVMIVLALIAVAGLFNLFYLRHAGARERCDNEATDNLEHSGKQP